MKFVMFVIDSDTNTGAADEMAAIDAFNEGLRANGNWIMAFGMERPGARSIQSSSEFYSGMWIIEAADLAEAQRLANEGSRACNRRVELRPFL